MRLLDTNEFLEACREAWKNSPARRAMHEGNEPAQTAAAVLPKKPIEYRPDMSVDDYERYLGELSEP